MNIIRLVLFFAAIVGSLNSVAAGGIFTRIRGAQMNSMSAYQVASVSATRRAALGMKGHLMSVERGHTTGVGWSSFNSRPNTCFGRGGANYAVVRGRDGWYATKVIK